MTSKQKQIVYGFRLFGILTSGIAMMLLVLVSAWLMGLYITQADELTSRQNLGDTIGFSASDSSVAFLDSLESEGGQVAGIVDESSAEETQLRNDAAAWLSQTRFIQGLDVTYRDGVLDRSAQNQARILANLCSLDLYSDWSGAIGLRADEGFIKSFSESFFKFDEITTLASVLPERSADYQRLFTTNNAYGVGVASVTSDQCEIKNVLVFHFADVR